MADINRILAVIEKGELTKPQLMTQYENVVAHADTNDADKETLISAIEKQLRAHFPAAAKKIFGAKDIQAREILTKIDIEIGKEFDLSKNRLRNGVKTGGQMISGNQYIQVYLSYKNASNVGATFVLDQETIDGELTALVTHYKTGGNDSGDIERRMFDLSDIKLAEDMYRSLLLEVIEPENTVRS